MLSLRSSLGRLLLVALVALALASCGGGSDSDDEVSTEDAAESTPGATTDDGSSDADDRAGITPIPDPDEPVVIPTSTPLPTATPLPTSTPVPLDAPTPSAILLGSAFTNDSKVTTVGIDEVFFGMTAEEAAEAASTEWVGESSSTSTCYKVVPSTGPSGVTLWIVDGFVERVDIENQEIRTPSQLGIGRTLAELESQLGDRLTSEELDDGSVVATFTPSDAGDNDFRLIFELVDDAVVRYRSGRVGIVELGDGECFSSLDATDTAPDADDGDGGDDSDG